MFVRPHSLRGEKGKMKYVCHLVMPQNATYDEKHFDVRNLVFWNIIIVAVHNIFLLQRVNM